MFGAESLADVALRPWPAASKDALTREDMLVQIEQLATERKQPLREITEKVLLEDIAAGRDGHTEASGEEQDHKEELSSQETLEKLAKARHEAFTKLEWTAFAAGNALNLVSILLSRDLNKYAGAKEPENIYTQVFRSMNVPRGSFGLVKGEPVQRLDRPDERERVRNADRKKLLVMKGSRMEALDWATDSLLKAATDLETNIRKETKYWEEILSISEKGWPLQRTRKGVRNAPFAVKYGAAEASGQFRARGLAPLRMDKDGGIILDPALTKKPKMLRVRISEGDNITGTSRATIKSGMEGLAIEQSIELARESLIEEELFYEMSLESRQLLAFGVELRDTVIHVPIPNEDTPSGERILLIDCIAEDEQTLSKSGGTHNWLAQNVAEALHVFLAHEHRMRLFRRTRMVLPMTGHKRQQPTPPLLRTLMGIFSHISAVDSLYAYLGAIEKTLKSAGLNTTLEMTRETNWEKLSEIVKDADAKDLTATDHILASLIRPFEGKAVLSIPSSSGTSPENITINTRTYIGAPHFGTEHKVTLPPTLIKTLNLEHDPMRQLKFSSTDEVKSYIDWLLSLDISQNLLFNEFPGRSIIKSSEPCIAVVSKGSKKGLVKEDDVEVELEMAALKITATSRAQLATGNSTESFTWNGTSGKPALGETIKRWIE